MFVFSPTSSLGYQPRYHVVQPSISPRERYLTALADARSAEAEYIAALAREQAAERQRLESARLSRQQDAIRRQLVFDSMLRPSSDYLVDHYSPYAASADFDPFISLYDDIHQVQERRHAALRRQQEEEKARRLAILRLQQEHEERIRRARQQQELQERIRLAVVLKQRQEQEQKCALRRQKEVGLKRKEAARRETEDIENLFRVLLGISSEQGGNKEQVVEPTATSAPKPQGASKPETCACRARVCRPVAPKPAPQPSGPAGPKPAAQQSEPAAPKKTSPPTTSTLKADLEKRLGNEYQNEIRDTIHAILLSLSHHQPSAATPAPATSNAVPVTNAKGKGKVVSFDVQPAAPTINDVANSLSQIRKIEASFQSLESDFIFPRNLDFTPPSSLTSSDTESTIKLAYTSHNAPIHNYTHALSVLLTQLDAIESFGSDDVRHRRKEVVDKVEGALEGVERVVEEKGRLSRRPSKETINKGEAVTESVDKKTSAKEFVATAAFTGSHDATEESTTSPTVVEPVLVAATNSLNGSDTPAEPVENTAVPAVEGYSVTDDDQVLESSNPTSEPVADSKEAIEQPVDIEAQFSPSEVSPEQAPVTSEPNVMSTLDTVEKVELLRTGEDTKDAVPTTILPTEEQEPEQVLSNPTTISTPLDGTTASPERADADDTFLLSSSSSPEFPPRRPNVTEDDVVVVDEGSDWSEVDA